MRNRVVAGMCEAVIVVESAVAGGSMIMAHFAGEQGRQIMVVPKRIDQTSSCGCHQLIRDGATMITSVDDILEELLYTRLTQTEVELPNELEASQVELNDLECHVLDCFTGGEFCLVKFRSSSTVRLRTICHTYGAGVKRLIH